MIYDKIRGNYSRNGYDLPASSIFVYYGEKPGSTGKVPSINYVASFDGTNIISGQFGKQWKTKIYTGTAAITGQTDTIYLCDVQTKSTNSKIQLPTEPVNGTQMVIDYIGAPSADVTVHLYSTKPNSIKRDSTNTRYHQVVLNAQTPQCLIHYDTGTWYVAYPGINLYNNMTPYWKTNIYTADTTVNAPEQNTRYVPKNVDFILNLPKDIADNFKLAIETQFLNNKTATINIANTSDTSTLIYSQGYESIPVKTITLDRRSKSVQIVKIDGNWHVFTNDREFWITEISNSSTITAKSGYRYITTNTTGATVNLPTSPKTSDRVAVYVEKKASNTIKIKSSDKAINVGSTVISAGDADGLEIEAPLVYVELCYIDGGWHVVKLITPSSQREYKAGWGFNQVGTNTFVLTGSIDTVDNVTLSSIVYDTTDNIEKYRWGVKSIYTKINVVPSVFLQKSENTSTGVTTISCTIPTPPSVGTYVLKSTNGSLSWIEVQTCD